MRRIQRDDSLLSSQTLDSLRDATSALRQLHTGVTARSGGKLGSDDFDRTVYASESVRDHLWREQERKCCYCEKPVEKKFQHVEHYRPKTAARRSATESREGYWWLAYVMDNLLYSCPDCNVNKKEWFPLAHGSQEGSEAAGVDMEEPMLLNPMVDDPSEHITFIPLPFSLGWRIAPLTDRGEWTIRHLGLDRDALDSLRDEVAHEVASGRDSETYVAAAQTPTKAFTLLRRCVLAEAS